MSILQTKNLSLSISGTKILDDLSIDIWEGHVHAIVGPNGAGKSIVEADLDKRARKGITLAWQEPARFEGLKVKDYLRVSSRSQDKKNLELSISVLG